MNKPEIKVDIPECFEYVSTFTGHRYMVDFNFSPLLFTYLVIEEV